MSSLIWLSLAAFGTSIISATIGMAGGIMLLSIMGNFFAPFEFVPLHGFVQLFSNSTRVVLNFNVVNRRIFALFGLGAMIGAAAASRVVVALPEREFAIGLAIFLLIVTWVPKLKAAPEIPGKFFWIGLVGTFVSVFVGAIGLIIGPFFARERMNKDATIATMAACQALLHFLKVCVFLALGFAFGKYLSLFACMVPAVLLGNWVGQRVTDRISENTFRWIFRISCSVLALRMLLLSLNKI